MADPILIYRGVNGDIYNISLLPIGTTISQEVSYSSSIPFNSLNTKMENHTIGGDITFTKNTVGTILFGITLLRLTSDGVHAPDFSDFKLVNNSSDYVNTNGVVNVFVFFFDGDDYWVTIYQEAVADTTAPTLSSATVENANPNKILLTYNENLDTGSIPATGDFAPSGGKTVTNVAISGSVVTITVNSNYANGDTITVSYTPGTNKIRDLADTPNNAVALSSQAVTNNISGGGGEENLIFGSFSAMTQTGTTLTGAGASWGCFGKATKKLASGVNGEIRGTPGSTSGAGIYFMTTGIAGNYATSAYGVFVAESPAANIYWVDAGSFTDSGLLWVDGDRFILRVISNVVSAYRLRSGVETLVKTFTTPRSGDLFINANLYQTGDTLLMPTGINVS